MDWDLLYFSFVILVISFPLFVHFHVPDESLKVQTEICQFATAYSYENESVLRPVVIAHRGSRGILPENTMYAFANSVLLGTDILEFDVRLTKDDQLVIIHDQTVDRTTNGTGMVRDLTLQQLKELDAAHQFSSRKEHGEVIFPLRGTGIQIPTFHEFLEVYQSHPFVVEVKDNEFLAMDKLLAGLEKFPQARERIVISHLNCTLIEYLRKQAPTLCIAACENECVALAGLSLLKLYMMYYTYVQKPMAEIFQMPSFQDGAILDTPELVEMAHAFGQKVHYWVVNEVHKMKHLKDIGADGFFTDRIDLGHPTYYRGCWHVVSRCLFFRYRH
eukprot:TRINITY_DN3445_c0_g1_i2.p1 TRINITY_DN3445_c0_g1~~TRINITY_DN3445_c0_g1_i2.p1  ORF type:complete len:331 (-),score=32.66 TRINITY_DN3445_c0_g1_i2:34-1026(-)